MAEYSRTDRFKVAVMLFVGFLCLAIIIALTYFTVQTIYGRIYFCTLWTDIPGRIAILIISYYVAGICGYFPIPGHHLLDFLPEPLVLWRLETWREICTCFLISNPFRRLSECDPDTAESPFVRDGDTEDLFYTPDIFIRQRSEPTHIIYPDERTIVPITVRPPPLPRIEIPVVSHSSSESFMSFGSPVAGLIVPGARTKSSRPHYLPSMDTTTEHTDGTGGPTVQQDTPPRTADDDIKLPNYPRYPWCFLRHPGGVPEVARKLHNKNLRKERRETEKLNRRQRRLQQSSVAATDGFPTEERAERGGIAEENSDRLSVHVNPRASSLPYRRKYPRHRIRSSSAIRVRKPREKSCSSRSDKLAQCDADGQEMNTTTEAAVECCKGSPNLQWKLERIKQVLGRTAESRQAIVDASEQNIAQERPRESEKSIDIDASEILACSNQANPVESNDEIPVISEKDESKHDSSRSDDFKK